MADRSKGACLMIIRCARLRDVSDALGINYGTVNKWSYGERKPNKQQRAQISDLFGVPAVAWDQPASKRDLAAAKVIGLARHGERDPNLQVSHQHNRIPKVQHMTSIYTEQRVELERIRELTGVSISQLTRLGIDVVINRFREDGALPAEKPWYLRNRWSTK